MKNDDHEILNAYVDGTLSGEERSDLERRLEEDAELREGLAALRELVSEARELPRNLQPRRDLWSGIESRIREDKVRRVDFGGFRRTFIAAAAMIAIFLTGLLTGVWEKDRASGPEVARTSEPAPPTASETDAAPEPVPLPYVEAENEYAAASQDLFEVLGQRSEALDAETVELIRRNLDIIDEAVREIRGALEDEPSNAKLNQMLDGKYRRRSDLLRQAADLPGTI